MTISQKYKIIANLRNSRATPTLTNDIYTDTYTLKTNMYNILLVIVQPSFDGEKYATKLTIQDNKTGQNMEKQTDNGFARLVALIIKRKYYNSIKTK